MFPGSQTVNILLQFGLPHALLLAGAKFNWLVNEEHLNEAFAEQFSELKQADLKVLMAWAIKARFRDYRYAGWARRHFDKWYAWAIRCRLEPSKEKARMVKNH